MAKNSASLLPAGSGNFLEDIKERVRSAQMRAAQVHLEVGGQDYYLDRERGIFFNDEHSNSCSAT